jgi:hypothetical protein
MLPLNLQGLATRRLASLPGRDSHPIDYATLPGRTVDLTPKVFFLEKRALVSEVLFYQFLQLRFLR